MNELLLSELLFSAISIGAFFVAREFFLSRNGVLRKLFIAYFVIEMFVYISSGVYFYLSSKGHSPISLGVFRLIVLTPKFFMKMRLLYYLKTKK